MARRGRFLILLGAVVATLGLWFASSRLSLSALDEPGFLETYAASKAKRWMVSRSARGPLPLAPRDDAASLPRGRMLFVGRCAPCHGMDGRTPTDMGQRMYPRTPDLSSPAAQQWSDAELFWIIKHGIRLSGMPALGNTYPDEQYWHIVRYVRTLGGQPKQEMPEGATVATQPRRRPGVFAATQR